MVSAGWYQLTEILNEKNVPFLPGLLDDENYFPRTGYLICRYFISNHHQVGPVCHQQVGGGEGGLLLLIITRRCPAQMALKLDLQDHEKAQWPPLHALKRVGGWTLVILGQDTELEEELKSSAGRSSGLWRQEERDSGRERDENIAPEGLVGFFREKITVKSSLSLFCQSLYHFGF